jgi:hypothetical protein
MEKVEQEKALDELVALNQEMGLYDPPPNWTASLPEYDCSDKPCIYPYCRTQDNKTCCFTNKETP